YRHGRRRPDTSLSGPHHRPDHRQLLGFCGRGATTAGLGQTSSTAAMMAAISSEVGSEGDVAVLSLRELLALGPQELEALDQHPSRVGGVDHVVDVAAL